MEYWFVRPKGNSGWKTGLSDPREIRGGQENWFVRPKGNRGWGWRRYIHKLKVHL